MIARILALSALAMATANVANAAVYYDTINVASANQGGYDGYGDGENVMAASFTGISGNPDLSVTLALSADNPKDTGSVMVYLVPDDGNGGSMGAAGDPLFTMDGSGNPIGFAGAVQIGTVLDTSLSNSQVGPTSVTLNVTSAMVAAVSNLTQNDEYWIGIVATSPSAEWWLNGDGTGVGTDSQADFQAQTPYGYAIGPYDSTAYEITVADAPEPGTLALLGGGLAGLGYVRRRKAKKT